MGTPEDGHRFVGWTGAVTGSSNPITVVVDSDKVLTAHFTSEPDGSSASSSSSGGAQRLLQHDPPVWLRALHRHGGGQRELQPRGAEHELAARAPGRGRRDPLRSPRRERRLVIPLSSPKNNVVVAVIVNTGYTYDGGTKKYGYTLTLGPGVTGRADILGRWYR